MLVDKEIEKEAVMELFTYLEKLTNSIIFRSVHEFDSLNSMREIQGLAKKTRMDRECIKRAIKYINRDIFTSLSEKTGGTISKKGEKNVMHTPELENEGVEII